MKFLNRSEAEPTIKSAFSKVCGRMRFRCHRKRIYQFASTLPFRCFSDCPTRSKMIELHVVTEVVRYANATNTRSCDIFGHRILFGFFFFYRFRPSEIIRYVHTNKMHFCFDPLARAFSNRCDSDENSQRISVNRRPKHIEMYAFSNEDAEYSFHWHCLTFS